MTITNTQTDVTYTGDGVMTAFDYPFLVPYQVGTTDPAMTVSVIDNSVAPPVTTVLTYLTDYTVTGVGVDGGGTVTKLGTVLPATSEIHIERTLAYTQQDVYLNQGFLPESVETSLDYLVMQIQQLNTRLLALENP